MKTLRELLLERHRAADAKLDAVRHAALATLSATEQRGLNHLLRHWLAPLRWHLAGLGAAWLLVAALNADPSVAERPTLARKNSPTAQEVIMALRENRRQILELIRPAALAEKPETPPSGGPFGRIESIFPHLIA